MPRENVVAKAHRLLTSGRIFVVGASRAEITTRARGDSGRVYETGFEDQRRSCWCDHRAVSTPCSHIVAVRLIFVESGSPT